MKKPRITPQDFASLYEQYNANLAFVDCGRKCAPLNKGNPICCDTENAIPVVDKAEFELLKSRTDLWFRYKPNDAASRKIVKELTSSACAIECKGAAFCERDNRTIACRSFPFYPYLDKAGNFIGLTYYWDFEDRCWIISNLQVVEQKFVQQMIAAFERIFKLDPDEYQTMKDHSANMRRVFSRQGKIIPVLHRDGRYYKIKPGSNGALTPCTPAEYKKFGPYKSEAAYIRAVKAAGGTLPPPPPQGYLAP
ncbi:MAG TPA: hypothetical protein VKZ87_15740 [Ferrovibrio sp.]|jgi:hypothetical protein|uniref:hypothetical protein n=1 Tax=Ferrovibrio sp. TaxID=1917215 RepID=UPI002B4AF98E|nr:hypothetical protein [Ferrovibrio sp.]HLT78835.1 hypothetical protein [Ferrovibrio sp.]